MTQDINLQWQSFSVDLNTIHTWMQANAGDHYCGLSANNQLQIHFTDDPGDSVYSAIAAYWASLDEDSDEATNYMAAADRAAAAAADKAAKLASAAAKLEALGLSADEIAALRG